MKFSFPRIVDPGSGFTVSPLFILKAQNPCTEFGFRGTGGSVNGDDTSGVIVSLFLQMYGVV